MSYVPKNYNTDGGDRSVIGGVLEFLPGARVKGFPGAVNLKPKATNTAGDIRKDLNDLITALKDAGLVIPDAWDISIKAVPTTSAMPTEQTIANSGHATVTIENNVITIQLDCKVSELADANHGETWGTHKWLGFGVNSGLASIVGIVFNDGTASVTLGDSDVSEATALGLSAGEFVLYVKAEKVFEYGGQFTLKASGYAETVFALRVLEPTAQS